MTKKSSRAFHGVMLYYPFTKAADVYDFFLQIAACLACLFLQGLFVALLLRERENGSPLVICESALTAIGGIIAYSAAVLANFAGYTTDKYQRLDATLSAILFLLAIVLLIAIFLFAKRFPKCAKPLFVCSALQTAAAVFLSVPLLPFLFFCAAL